MEKRLKLAKNLLKDTGVIFISIDDNEVAQLKLLMDDKNRGMFGEDNFLATICWQSTDTLRNDAKHFSANSEYILVYARNKIKCKVMNNHGVVYKIIGFEGDLKQLEEDLKKLPIINN
jgi:adenine-specific DNA-methyltransferase